MTTKEAIKGFIQTIYAFVIGFGFFQIKVTNINFHANIDWEIIFNIGLYIFTFIIAAHDWLEFHKRDLPDKMNFAMALPQMFSLLSIGFMFLHSTYSDLLLWSMGGIALTIFNLVELLVIKTSNCSGKVVSMSMLFLSIIILILIIWLLYQDNQLVSFKPWYLFWLGILVVLVCTNWICRVPGKNKLKAANSLNPPTDLEKLSAAIETINQLIADCKENTSQLSKCITELASINIALQSASSNLVSHIDQLKSGGQ